MGGGGVAVGESIDKLREWSERYGMVNPDDLDLIHGGLRARF
jgi:hypothetical protein